MTRSLIAAVALSLFAFSSTAHAQCAGSDSTLSGIGDAVAAASSFCTPTPFRLSKLVPQKFKWGKRTIRTEILGEIDGTPVLLEIHPRTSWSGGSDPAMVTIEDPKTFGKLRMSYGKKLRREQVEVLLKALLRYSQDPGVRAAKRKKDAASAADNLLDVLGIDSPADIGIDVPETGHGPDDDDWGNFTPEDAGPFIEGGDPFEYSDGGPAGGDP